MRHIPTASQTVGPFFNFGLTTNAALGVVAGPEIPGERIRLTIRVTDGDGAPACGDAMVEVWQADANGEYGAFPGFGRLETGSDGSCTFETIRPGRVPAPDGTLQAPHLNVLVFARGVLKHLHTRIYFEGDPANEDDLVLRLVPEERRATLLARACAEDSASACASKGFVGSEPARPSEEDSASDSLQSGSFEGSSLPASSSADNPAAWRFEVALQGDHETVFFDG